MAKTFAFSPLFLPPFVFTVNIKSPWYHTEYTLLYMLNMLKLCYTILKSMPPSCYCMLLNKQKISSETVKKWILPKLKWWITYSQQFTTLYQWRKASDHPLCHVLPRTRGCVSAAEAQGTAAPPAPARPTRVQQRHKHGHRTTRQRPHHEIPPGTLFSPSGHSRARARTLTSEAGQHGRRWPTAKGTFFFKDAMKLSPVARHTHAMRKALG